MIQKLKQNKGETLIETMISMLIAVLCMGILCTSVAAATNINKKTREMDEKYAKELRIAESRSAEAGTTEGKVIIDFAEEADVEIDVILYGAENADSPYVSYTKGGT